MGCYNSELPIGPPGPTGPQGPAGELPYKIYTALLTQFNENAPTAIVLEDTIGGITFSYSSVGVYAINSADKFTVDKTFILNRTFQQNAYFYSINYNNSSLIEIYSVMYDEGGPLLPVNGMSNLFIEIRVYN